MYFLQIAKKLEQAPLNSYTAETGRRMSNCTIFLGFTSNLISCGVRETLRYLAQHNMVRIQYSVFIIIVRPMYVISSLIRVDYCRITMFVTVD